MKNMIIPIVSAGLLILASCGDSGKEHQRYNGQIDTDVIRLSAKVAGEIDSLTVDEGQDVRKGQLLVKIDSDKIVLQLRQQQARMKELDVSLETLNARIKQVRSQLDFTSETLEKTERMVSAGAATVQKRDELSTQKDVLAAQLDGLLLNRKTISAKKEQLSAAIDLTRLNLSDARVTSPVNGTVLNRFFKQAEVVNPGAVILEIADLSEMEATIYVSQDDLARVTTGQEVKIWVDGQPQSLTGKVSWIASQAEFTPKTILTPETRTTLVYAVKIKVSNPEGILKIGMPVEVEI